jgi:hypothetical protein
MASTKKKSGSKRRASVGAKKRELLRTGFMAEFTKEFIGHGSKSWLWPAPGQLTGAIGADYQTFVSALLGGIGYGTMPSFSSGSLGDRIVQFLTARNWPTDPTGIPEKYRDEQDTVRLVEISVILDRLLHAANSVGGTGGGPGTWPPH